MHLVGLYTYCRMMHGAYNVTKRYSIVTVEDTKACPLIVDSVAVRAGASYSWAAFLLNRGHRWQIASPSDILGSGRHTPLLPCSWGGLSYTHQCHR